MSCDNRDPVLSNLLKSLRKRDKMLGKPRVYLFSPISLINSVKQKHSCKILYDLVCHIKFVAPVKNSFDHPFNTCYGTPTFIFHTSFWHIRKQGQITGVLQVGLIITFIFSDPAKKVSGLMYKHISRTLASICSCAG